MSTEYYKLRKPFTHLELDSTGSHGRLKVWIEHGLSGMLTIPDRHLADVLRPLFNNDGDYPPPLRTHWGGKQGAVVTVNDESLPDEAVVLSEYGDLLTVAQVKTRAGATRKDGMPTEPFGYEDAES